MKESDKIFIKKTIEDTIDKKLDGYEKHLEEQNKKSKQNLGSDSNAKLYEQKLLDSLRQRDSKANTTFAQRLERIKLEKTAWQQTKDNVRQIGNAGKDVLSGASNVATSLYNGVDSVLTPLANITPETAMLYNITKGVLTGGIKTGIGVTKGAFKMGVGTLKGMGAIGKGTYNILKASKDMFFREQKGHGESTQLPKNNMNYRGTISQDNNQNKINSTEMILTQRNKTDDGELSKFLKETQKKDNFATKTTNLLAKGLTGLGSTLNTISDGINLITKNGKLILGGITMGVVAILALKTWIRNGGLNTLMDKAKDNILKSLASEGGQEARKKADAYVQSQLQQIDTDAAKYTQHKDEVKVSTPQNISNNAGVTKDMNNYQKQQAYSNYIYKQGTKSSVAELLASKMTSGSMKATYQKVGIVRNTDLKFPFKTKVLSVQTNKDTELVGFEIERYVGNKHTVSLYFTNAVKGSVKSNTTYSANTKVAVLTPDTQIWGDINAFYDLGNGQTAKDALIKDRQEQIIKQANKIMDEPYHTAGLDSVNRMADEKLGVFKKYTQQDLVKDEIPQNKLDITPLPTNNVNNGNDSSKKAQQQTKQMEQQKQNDNLAYNSTNTLPTNTLPTKTGRTTIVPTNTTPTVFSTTMSIDEIACALPDTNVDSIG